MNYRCIAYGLSLSLGLACGSSGSKKDKPTPPPGSTPLTGNDCSGEEWSLALAGLVINDQGDIGQDGTGLPPTEQTSALLLNLSAVVSDDYVVHRQAQGVQRKLNTLTQFSAGYPQSATDIAIRGGNSRMVKGCQSLSKLLKGKSLVSERGEPAVYRTFALKHDFSESVKPLMENPSQLLQDGLWNRELPVFKGGIEATPQTHIVDAQYKSNADPKLPDSPELVALYRHPAEFVCEKPFRIKAFTLRYQADELESSNIATDQCVVVNALALPPSYDCVHYKVEHTADNCSLLVQGAEISASEDTSKVSFSGKLESNAGISADRKAPFYSLTVDRIRID